MLQNKLMRLMYAVCNEILYIAIYIKVNITSLGMQLLG